MKTAKNACRSDQNRSERDGAVQEPAVRHMLTALPSVPRQLLSQNQRQPVLAIPDHHDFRVRALRQVLRSLDALPFKQRRRNALSDDLLEVADSSGFDALALRFLRF